MCLVATVEGMRIWPLKVQADKRPPQWSVYGVVGRSGGQTLPASRRDQQRFTMHRTVYYVTVETLRYIYFLGYL